MATDDYAGPPVALGPEAVRAIRSRVERIVRIRGAELHREAVREWAGQNDGCFPTMRETIADAREELEVLINGLGKWAAVTSDDLPKAMSRRAGRFNWADWE